MWAARCLSSERRCGRVPARGRAGIASPRSWSHGDVRRPRDMSLRATIVKAQRPASGATTLERSRDARVFSPASDHVCDARERSVVVHRVLSIEVTGTSIYERSTWGDVKGVPTCGTSEMPAGYRGGIRVVKLSHLAEVRRPSRKRGHGAARRRGQCPQPRHARAARSAAALTASSTAPSSTS